MAISRKKMVSFLDQYLSIDAFKDYSVNGLQVEGSQKVGRIALAVDGCLSVFKQAAVHKADMVIVHHGIVWGGIPSITGSVKKQIELLLRKNINLYGAHLPLDLHPESGNNAGLAELLNLQDIQPFGGYHGTSIGCCGLLSTPRTVQSINRQLRKELGGKPSALPFGPERVRSVAIVSGGGSDCLPEAIERNIDCFITGESDHKDYHRALEGRITVVYGGHYETETIGVKRLGMVLERSFDVETFFIDEPTLV